VRTSELLRSIVNNEMVDSLALFDLDNTLLDREKAFALWATGFVASNGLDHHARAVIDRADADGIAPRDEFFSELRRELGVATEINELVAEYYSEYPSNFSVEPETIEGIRLLRSSGFKVAVVTNGPASQWHKLEAAGIENEFDAVCISAVVGSWKPDLPIFTKAAQVCDVALEGWMVGDSAQADIVGGANAGLRTIWMARGRVWTLDGLSPDHIVDSIPQAIDVILKSR
jgi:putative hydrolase of the HAD superfamily